MRGLGRKREGAGPGNWGGRVEKTVGSQKGGGGDSRGVGVMT